MCSTACSPATVRLNIISDLPNDLHLGRYVRITERLVRISAPGAAEIIAFPKEHDAARLENSEDMIFIPDNLLQASIKTKITNRAPTGEAYLKEDALSGMYRGPIAVTPDDEGNAVPTTAIFRLTAKADANRTDLHAVRGVAIMKGKRQSPAGVFFRRVGQVLIREGDF